MTTNTEPDVSFELSNILDTVLLTDGLLIKRCISKHTSLEYCVATHDNATVSGYQDLDQMDDDIEANLPERRATICTDLDWLKYRSVISDPDTHRLLCVAPWTALTSSDFVSNGYTVSHLVDRDTTGQPCRPVVWWKTALDQLSSGNNSQFMLDEMVEGTMINLFYDPRSEKWEIATRKNVGADCWFYRTQYFNLENTQKTFRQMFMDAFPAHYVHAGNGVGDPDINDIELICDLPKHYCYSFVLQHPENHIVYPVHSPALYLVGVFELINHTPAGEDCVFNAETQQWNHPPRVRYINAHSDAIKELFAKWLDEYILYLPTEWGQTRIPAASEIIRQWSEVDPNDVYNKMHYSQFSYRNQWLMGFAFTDIYTGLRFTVENPYYVATKELRGNNPNLFYHFLELNRAGKVDAFLYSFPQYQGEFYDFQGVLYGFIQAIYAGYVEYYVKQIKTPIEKRYFVHIAKLHHEVFLPSVQTPPRKPITFRVVQEYVFGMEPKKLYYYLVWEPSMGTQYGNQGSQIPSYPVSTL